MFEEDFAGRVLPFDEPAAHAYAQLAAERRQAGRPKAQFSMCRSLPLLDPAAQRLLCP
jgi:predicted nucleic acid-binding protein